MDKFEKVRSEQFPLADKCVYLDTPTTGLLSKNARDRMNKYIDWRFEEAMDMYAFSDLWEHADKMREPVAKMIGADPGEIFFSGSGSDMLNIFSNGIELAENANVVTSGLSFPSTPYNWMNRVGAENVRIAQPENGMVPCEKLFELVDENTAVIALCYVENTSGWKHDIKRIGEFCRERGIYLVLDLTQCIGAVKIDVKETPVDFLVATTYKWISGLFGISIGYASKKVLEKIRPRFVGWTGNVNRLDQSKYVLNLSPDANRFETGSLCWIGLEGLEESVNLYLNLGIDDVNDRIAQLTDYLYEKVEGAGKVELVGPFPKENRSCISYLRLPEGNGLTDAVLRENGIRAHMASETTMRIGLHYFNNESDIDKLIDYLESI